MSEIDCLVTNIRKPLLQLYSNSNAFSIFHCINIISIGCAQKSCMLLSKQNGSLGKHSVFFISKHSVFFSKRDIIFTSIIIPFASLVLLLWFVKVIWSRRGLIYLLSISFFFKKKNSVVDYFGEIVHSCSSTHLDPKCWKFKIHRRL